MKIRYLQPRKVVKAAARVTETDRVATRQPRGDFLLHLSRSKSNCFSSVVAMSTRGDSTPKFHSTNKRNKPPRKPKPPTVDEIDQARVFGSPTKKGGPPLHCKIAIIIDSGRKDGVSRTVAVTLGQLGAWVAYTYPSDQQRAAAMEIGEEVRNVGGLAFVIRSSPFDLAAAQALVRSVMIHFGVRHIDIIGKLRSHW